MKAKPKILLRFTFVKKASMPKDVISYEYIKCYSLGNPRPVKIPGNSVR